VRHGFVADQDGAFDKVSVARKREPARAESLALLLLASQPGLVNEQLTLSIPPTTVKDEVFQWRRAVARFEP
jgi:hypothetical protein